VGTVVAVRSRQDRLLRAAMNKCGICIHSEWGILGPRASEKGPEQAIKLLLQALGTTLLGLLFYI
jgi:hypothetical protein